MNKSVEKLVTVNPEKNLSCVNETQKDFDDRVLLVQKEENKRRREAILKHLSLWNSRIKVDESRNISNSRAEMIKSMTNSVLVSAQKPIVRKSGKFHNSTPFSTSHAQILSLLNLAGFETEQELRLAEAILMQYYEPLHEAHKDFFDNFT